MFKMRNKLGNAIIVAKTERRRDELLRLGFTEIKEQTEGYNFSSMKVDELKKYAASSGIDISAAKNKADIIKILTESI